MKRGIENRKKIWTPKIKYFILVQTKNNKGSTKRIQTWEYFLFKRRSQICSYCVCTSIIVLLKTLNNKKIIKIRRKLL